MAVLIEAISVVVPNRVIDARYPGGIAAYRADVPNSTFCTDGSLTRVGFMSPLDVKEFHSRLASRIGVAIPTGGEWFDLAAVDQFEGPTLPTPWLQVGEVDGVAAAWLEGEIPGPLAAPANWKPGDSKSMTLWRQGKHGTVEAHRAPDAPPIDWRGPFYSGRAFVDPPAEPDPPGEAE